MTCLSGSSVPPIGSTVIHIVHNRLLPSSPNTRRAMHDLVEMIADRHNVEFNDVLDYISEKADKPFVLMTEGEFKALFRKANSHFKSIRR